MPAGKYIKLQNGEEYESLSALCKAYNVKRGPVEYAYKSNKSIDEALADQLAKQAMDNKLYSNFGETSFKKICRKYKISDLPVRELVNSGVDIVDAFNIVISNKRKIVNFRGISFPTMKDCCEHFGVHPITVYKEMRKNNIEFCDALEKYLDRHTHDKQIEVLGKHWNSFSELCNYFGIYYQKVSRRIDQGFEIEAALLIDKTSNMFIGLDNKAYYKVSWSTDPVTTREVIEHYRPDLLDVYDKSNPTGEYRPYKRESD